MPKKKIKRIRLDAPNERAVYIKDRIAALESEAKKKNPEFKIPEGPGSRKPQ